MLVDALSKEWSYSFLSGGGKGHVLSRRRAVLVLHRFQPQDGIRLMVPAVAATRGSHRLLSLPEHGVAVRCRISPDGLRNERPASKQSLREQIKYYYTSNAEASTLRKTLGCCLPGNWGKLRIGWLCSTARTFVKSWTNQLWIAVQSGSSSSRHSLAWIGF